MGAINHAHPVLGHLHHIFLWDNNKRCIEKVIIIIVFLCQFCLKNDAYVAVLAKKFFNNFQFKRGQITFVLYAVIEGIIFCTMSLDEVANPINTPL